MDRRTKIVATLGPSTDSPEVIDDIIRGGVDVVRLNFSHGTAEDHRRRAEIVRERAEQYGRHVAVLGDLQGPKIRIERFKEGKITLKEGDPFILDAGCGPDDGDHDRVGLTYKPLVRDVQAGDTLLLDDGRIVLKVEDVSGFEIQCHTVVGGALSNNKGINRQGGGLSAPAITDKDRADIRTASEIDVDYLAVSFPRSADDVEEARALMAEAGGSAGIVSKIERAEAVDVIDEIIEASDVIMIARGDLGVEIGDAELPAVQKAFIRKARAMNRVVITATQMMESMVENPIPTRAEVFDVANAVLDGTDAVMLSGETAAGKYPAKVVEAMGRICRHAERQELAKTSDHRIDKRFTRIDETIAMSAMYAANHMDIGAIAALTESGATPKWMSRISSDIPIHALTRHVKAARRMALFKGVVPTLFDYDTQDHHEINRQMVEELLQREVLHEGDKVIITKGDLLGQGGRTNALKIVRVGDVVNY